MCNFINIYTYRKNGADISTINEININIIKLKYLLVVTILIFMLSLTSSPSSIYLMYPSTLDDAQGWVRDIILNKKFINGKNLMVASVDVVEEVKGVPVSKDDIYVN